MGEQRQPRSKETLDKEMSENRPYKEGELSALQEERRASHRVELKSELGKRNTHVLLRKHSATDPVDKSYEKY